jgi:hypothetical protein
MSKLENDNDYYILFKTAKLNKREAKQLGVGFIFGIICLIVVFCLPIEKNKTIDYLIISIFVIGGYILGCKIFKKKNKGKAHGSFEKIVYRAFDKDEYVHDFMNGKVRFGRIDIYTKIEDEKLRDATEGQGLVVVNGIRTHSQMASRVTYISCFHRSLKPAIDSSRPYIVEISNTKKLAEYITKALESETSGFWGGVEGVNVEYDKGEIRENNMSPDFPAYITYSQKPEQFQNENESRFVIISKKDLGEYYTVDLKTSISGCKLIKI